jgi:hypothetical protein
VKEELSLPRRIARAIFAAIGVIFLILIPLPLVLDQEMRTVFVGHDWGNPVFRDLANALSVWFILGVGLLFLAWLVRKANVWGLLACTLVNVVLLLGFLSGAKEVILVPFLCISLICLLVEEWKLMIGLKKRTA